jgi:3-deoxy-7-phosphoheptulonate synthase
MSASAIQPTGATPPGRMFGHGRSVPCEPLLAWIAPASGLRGVATIATMSSSSPRRLDPVRDQRIDDITPLAPPELLLAEHPLGEASAEVVLRGRSAVADILNRVDDRLLVVVGPCSVHDADAAFSYAQLLRAAARELEDDLFVVMRVYFEKPRTTTGWKGLINDPHLDDSGDVNAGLRIARKLVLEILQTGLPVGCEFLDPIMPQYIADAVSWGAIGARTTESQVHRQLASGLSMPVGFKNRTDGNVGVAVDAVGAATAPHVFTGIDLSGTPAVLRTAGNPDCHLILRGGSNAPNYSTECVSDAVARLRAAGLPARVVLDASHDNSGKDHHRQAKVAGEIAAQVGYGNAAIVGVMLESFLLAGRQQLDGRPLTYGQSITDACMSWETTDAVLRQLAKGARTRRAIGPT